MPKIWLTVTQDFNETAHKHLWLLVLLILGDRSHNPGIDNANVISSIFPL